MTSGGGAAGCREVLSADDLLSWVDQLAAAGCEGETADVTELIDQIASLERVKRAASAAQARLSIRFDEHRRAQQVLAGVPAVKVGRGVADQVALARGESPHRGERHLGLARALVQEMPGTMAALTRGDISEWGATVVVRETAALAVEHRREVDARLEATTASSGVSERQLAEAARSIGYELDAQAAVRRASKAESDRCVTIRPAPDTMTYLTALLPVGDGVGAYAHLVAAARAAAAAGDPRSRGQVMADTLVARLTGSGSGTSEVGSDEAWSDGAWSDGAWSDGAWSDGARSDEARNDEARNDEARNDDAVIQTFSGSTVPGLAVGSDVAGSGQPVDEDARVSAAGPARPSAPTVVREPAASAPRCTRGPAPAVAVHVVMTDVALFGGGDEPATVVGYGPVPASVARDLLAQAAAADLAWLRRLWTRPSDGELVGLDSRSRRFPSGLARLIRLRDQVCSTPWCDAPIRHVDHVVPWASGGPTSPANGQGLCEHCNLVKEDSGSATVRAGSRTAVTTPTGHVYVGDVPPPLGQPPPRGRSTTDTGESLLEQCMRSFMAVA